MSISVAEQPVEQAFLPAPADAEAVGHVALQTVRPEESPWSPEQQQATEAALQMRLDAMQEHVPEVVREAERITRGAAELIETFRLKPEFFDDAMRSTIFASLALANGKLQDARKAGDQPKQELERQRKFIGNASFLLTHSHASAFTDLHEQHAAERGALSSEQRKAILDKYEQPEVTHALDDYIERNGLLTDLREKLATNDNAEPTYHVLGISRYPSGSFDPAENGLTTKEVEEWGRGLEARTERFAQEFPEGVLASRAEGFAMDVHTAEGDEHHIYLPMASAEVLMAQERGITPSQYARDTHKAERTAGTIRHEYVHTQGDVIVGDAFGKSLEERRAEYFSGDNGEYYEVKTFFRHLQLLNGKYIGDMFEEIAQARHDDNPITIYEVLARDYGLGTVAEIAAAQPDAYTQLGRGSVFTRNMLQSLGGYTAIIERAAHNGYVDQEAARTYTARVINNFRAEKAKNAEVDADYEEFLGGYFAPVLNSLGMHLPDIPYTPPAITPEQAN